MNMKKGTPFEWVSSGFTIGALIGIAILAWIKLSNAGIIPCLTCDPEPKATFYVVENLTDGTSTTIRGHLNLPIDQIATEGPIRELCVRACNYEECSSCAQFWYNPADYFKPEPEPGIPIKPDPGVDNSGNIIDYNNQQGCFIGGTYVN